MSEPGKYVSKRVCPVCGRQSGLNLGIKNSFRLFSCQSCATLFAAEDDTSIQAADYTSYYTPENLSVPPFVRAKLDEIVATFEPYRMNNRLLDVGFGSGSLMEAAARQNWEPFGVEVSQSAVQHVRALGFEVFCGELEKAGYPDDYFDVVVASEVLEHIPEPRALLGMISRVLRPGGLLWATTPHGRGLSGRLLGVKWSVVAPPEHLQLFSLKGVKKLFQSEGLRCVEVQTRGTNPFEIVHVLFRRAKPIQSGNNEATPDGFDRVNSSYQLNESLSGKSSGRILRALVNGVLNAWRMGDSINIRAQK